MGFAIRLTHPCANLMLASVPGFDDGLDIAQQTCRVSRLSLTDMLMHFHLSFACAERPEFIPLCELNLKGFIVHKVHQGDFIQERDSTLRFHFMNANSVPAPHELRRVYLGVNGDKLLLAYPNPILD